MHAFNNVYIMLNVMDAWHEANLVVHRYNSKTFIWNGHTCDIVPVYLHNVNIVNGGWPQRYYNDYIVLMPKLILRD